MVLPKASCQDMFDIWLFDAWFDRVLLISAQFTFWFWFSRKISSLSGSIDRQSDVKLIQYWIITDVHRSMFIDRDYLILLHSINSSCGQGFVEEKTNMNNISYLFNTATLITRAINFFLENFVPISDRKRCTEVRMYYWISFKLCWWISSIVWRVVACWTLIHSSMYILSSDIYRKSMRI